MKTFLRALLLFLPIACAFSAQIGVILGALDMREAKFVVQTDAPFEGVLVCVPEGDGLRTLTASVRTDAASDFLAKPAVGPLAPGARYAYRLQNVAGETQAKGAFTAPANYRDRTPPPEYAVAFLGGHHDNEADFDPPFKTPGGDYGIYQKIGASAPSLAVWLGDHAILREADRGSRSGVYARYAHARAQKELSEFMANTPNVAVWGAGETAGADCRTTLLPVYCEAFRAHWANPTFGAPNLDANCTQIRLNDAEFFLLDGRTFRDMSDPARTLDIAYGEAQLKWLLEALTHSDAAFKVVVSNDSFLCPIDLKNNPVSTAQERDAFLEGAKARGIGGLIFVSGGKPFGETTKFVRANAYDLYDFCVGPVTARPDEAPSTINYLKVPGSTTRGRQYALITFAGPEDARTATFAVYDADGKRIYKHLLRRKELE